MGAAMRRDSALEDPTRDPEVAHLLETVSRSLSVSSQDDDELRARIVVAAESRLAERTGRRTAWWAPLAAWTRPALPIGAGACLALVAGLAVLEPPSREETAVLSPTEIAEGSTDAWTAYLGSAEDTDPAVDLLAAQSDSDFLRAILEFPLDHRTGAAQ